MEPTPLQRTTFKIARMDCSSEEQLVRLALADRSEVKRLAFDLPARVLEVTHAGGGDEIERALESLDLGAAVVDRSDSAAVEAEEDDDRSQRRFLKIVLAINAALFGLELATGLWAGSMGLIADSLDMLADAIVYGLSLYAVGKAAAHKKRTARLSGYFQLVLAVCGVAEVLRRFYTAEDEPSFALMIGVSLVALAGNVASLWVLQKAGRKDVHMQASWIFTTNDVLVNLGVIAAGVLVFCTASKIPDLAVGAAVFCLVGYGAVRILRLSK